MAEDIKRDLGYLGVPYQKRLIAQIISDYKYANNIIDIIKAEYFTDETLRLIVAEIKDAFDERDVIPDIDSLKARLANRNDSEVTKLFIDATINQISALTQNDFEEIQDTGMKFCKQQELKKSVREIQEIIDRGNLDDYDKCEDILKRALEVGSSKDDGISVFYDLDSVLSEDFRSPIRTGIHGLDRRMNGGLAKGELGVVLAPFGVGKTTMITKIANTAFNDGLKVLQIFFEDLPKVIQRKHISCWSGIELNSLGEKENRPLIDEILTEKNDSGGSLMLKKFPSDGTTIPTIRQYVRKLTAQGMKPDVILLDYIDCVSPSKSYDSEWSGEGAIMRQYETLLSEFDIAGWTAVQGNRGSITAETVNSSMIGGSIKKGQIGHFIVSIAKTLEQKETGRANMAILKSRFGIDGIVFPDILFDNAKIQIDIDSNNEGQTNSEAIQSKDDNHNRLVSNLLNNMEKDINNL